MTAQFDDIFRYSGAEYSVSGISAGHLFDPTLLGLHPVSSNTACWRGYVASFALEDRRLVLDALDVDLYDQDPSAGPVWREGATPQCGPTIHGVTPAHEGDHSALFNNRYEGLSYHLEYTGGLLIGSGFIEELYVHMGFHPAWKYKNVIELVFEAGVLRKQADRSAAMEAFRQSVGERSEPGDPSPASEDEIRAFIERSFDRSYRLM